MDVPVVLGIAAAFAGSVAATWRGYGDVYFDSITMFIFLLLCSRYLDCIGGSDRPPGTAGNPDCAAARAGDAASRHAHHL